MKAARYCGDFLLCTLPSTMSTELRNLVGKGSTKWYYSSESEVCVSPTILTAQSLTTYSSDINRLRGISLSEGSFCLLKSLQMLRLPDQINCRPSNILLKKCKRPKISSLYEAVPVIEVKQRQITAADFAWIEAVSCAWHNLSACCRTAARRWAHGTLVHLCQIHVSVWQLLQIHITDVLCFYLCEDRNEF